MASIETWFDQDLKEAVKVHYLDGNIFSQDNNGNIIGVNVFDGGEPATLGGSVSANVIRPDGITIAVAGTLSGNKASVNLPQDAYAVPGVVSVIIKLTSGSDITTLCAVVSNVYLSSTDTVVDPGTIIPSIQTLIAEIEAAIASVPADYSNLLDAISDEYSSSAIYPTIGHYVWYNGELKRNIVPITTAETYTDAHWVNVVLGNDISNLSNTISETAGVVSSGIDLLSNSLSDKTETSQGITYSLIGNTITAIGTAIDFSAFNMLGSTTSTPPSWLVGGRKYVVKITNTTPLKVRFRAKTTTETSIFDFADFTISGEYVVTIPANITIFNLLVSAEQGDVVNGTLAVTVCDAVLSNKTFNLSTIGAKNVPDNTDIDTLLTDGVYYITSKSHAQTMAHLPITMACKIIVMSISQEARKFQLWFGTDDAAPIFVRYYTGTLWKSWQKAIYEATTNAIINRVSALEKTIRIRYQPWVYGKATERINVYVPATVGYIIYRLYHFVDESTNCNGWQIFHAYWCDDNLANEIDFTISGEWECALHLDGRDDFSGGVTHGDEVGNNLTMLMDGVPVDYTTILNTTNCKNIRFVSTSKLYDPANHTTAIADHGKEWVFDKNGLTINQSIKWLVSEPLTNCFMAMFLPSKNYIDRAYLDAEQVIYELPSSVSIPLGDSIVVPNARSTEMFDTLSGFSANVSVPIYPTGLTGGDQASIADNNGESYNKLYYRVCNGGQSTVGELWMSRTVYMLDYKPQ